MAIGRTFKEALQKALRGLEIGHTGLDNKVDYKTIPDEKVRQRLEEPNASRIFTSNTRCKKAGRSKRSRA